MSSTSDWWANGVIYQIYPRSYADANADGVGDLAGVTSRLDHVAELGGDAVWISPWYPSPLVDGGYDVVDYCAIAPELGTLADADALIARAHDLGLRVILDLVANHSSHEHPWFAEALTGGPGSPARARYHFADGRGMTGELPPNNWICAFGGSAWTRTVTCDGVPGQWYLHSFAAEQPDLNWANPQVVAEFEQIMRFWFDRGVDGFRVDALPAMAKAAGLPEARYDRSAGFATRTWQDSPHWDRPEVHGIVRALRKVCDSYPEPRFLVGECVVSSPQRLANYVRPDELHSTFNFDFLYAGWEASRLRTAIDATLDAHASVAAVPSWVLGSHDETRLVTRFGRQETRAGVFAHDATDVTDLELGLRRARAALLLELALPGTVTLYQGDELGLPEVIGLPDEVLALDPVYERSGRAQTGRAGCRVPLPWEGDEPTFGFSAPGVAAWAPQPNDWDEMSVRAQWQAPDSTLRMVARAITIRRTEPDLVGVFEWLPGEADVLRFRRGERFHCVSNLGSEPVQVDPRALLLASGTLDGDELPPDTTAWLRVD